MPEPSPRRTITQMVAEAKSRIEELSVEQLQAELADSPASATAAATTTTNATTNTTVVDIRDFRERLEKGAIPGAVSAPRGMLEFWFDPESPYYRKHYAFDHRYVLYCAGGQRSALATDVLQQIGYTNVAHLDVGFNGWAAAGGAVEDVNADSKWVKRD